MKKHFYTKKHNTKLYFGQSLKNDLTHTHQFILKSKLFHPFDSINLNLFLADEKFRSQTTGYYSLSAADQAETSEGGVLVDSPLNNDFVSSTKDNNLIIKKMAVA